MSDERPPTPPSARAAWTLRARVTALAMAVAALVAVIGGVLSVQFVRASLEDQARARLSVVLGSLAEREGTVDETAAELDAEGILWAVVSAEGGVRGSAARYVESGMAESLSAGIPVSATVRKWAAPVVLEGVPVGDGGLILATAEEEINAASRALVWRIVAALLIGVAVAGAAGAWFASRVSGPLALTARAADAMAGGRRAVPMPASTIPEVSAIGAALTALDHSLATSEGRQREFLLSISHELRTPLTAIRGYAEGLADGTFHGDAVRRAGGILEAETARLHRFVDDLLELARLEVDDFNLDVSSVIVTDLLRSARDVWEATASRDRITIDLDLDSSALDLRIEVDPRRLRQIIDGLIENALRVAPAGSVLTLGLQGGDAPAVTVRDMGPGLTDDDLARAFDRRALADRYRDSRPVGSGLGLSIADRLAKRLGLRLEAGRPAGHPGTTMTVYLDPRRPHGGA